MHLRPGILAMMAVALALALGPMAGRGWGQAANVGRPIAIQAEPPPPSEPLRIVLHSENVRDLRLDGPEIEKIEYLIHKLESASRSTEKLDLVTTTRGDRMMGAVVALESGGSLHLAGRQFQGEVVVEAGAIDRLTLQGAEAAVGGDEVFLTNGDRLVGTLSAITSAEVVLDTPVAGRLKIARPMVRIVSLGGAEDTLLDSAFAAGKMDPWEAAQGDTSWTVIGGVLVYQPGRPAAGVMRPMPTAIRAKVDQKDAVTMMAKVAMTDGAALAADLYVFADAGEPAGDVRRPGRANVGALFRGSQVFVQYTAGTISSNIIQVAGRRSALSAGVLRLAYDPATGKVKTWIDSQLIGEVDIPTKPTAGQYVMFNTSRPAKVEYLKVLRGIIPPADPGNASLADQPEETAVDFANRDHVTATQVELADGRMTLATGQGPVRCTAKSVARIVFGRKGLQSPAPCPDAAQVTGGFGRLTLQFQRLSADELVGRSDVLGEVRLRRAAIREVKFSGVPPK